MQRHVRIVWVCACLVAPMLGALSGCGEDPKEIQQAPITKEMESQAEASSKYMMEQMQPKKAAPK